MRSDNGAHNSGVCDEHVFTLHRPYQQLGEKRAALVAFGGGGVLGSIRAHYNSNTRLTDYEVESC